MDGHICLVQLVFLLNVLYAQSPANGGGKLYLGHVDNEDFISDLQLLLHPVSVLPLWEISSSVFPA